MKREKLEKDLRQMGCGEAGIAPTIQTLWGNDRGIGGGTTTWAVWQRAQSGWTEASSACMCPICTIVAHTIRAQHRKPSTTQSERYVL